MNTPWGKSTNQKTLAPGIVFYSTERHGGFYLSQKRLLEMPEVLRTAIDPYFARNTKPWFEEDEDWSLVCLAFPEYFTQEECSNAIRTAGRASGDPLFPGHRPWRLDIDAYLSTDKGRQCAAKAGLERQDGISPSPAHWVERGIVSGALEGVGSPGRDIPSRRVQESKRSTLASMHQLNLFFK